MKKFRKKFNLQNIKRSVCYSVLEITELLRVHKRTVLSWHKEGLQPIDNKTPYYFHGFVLREFLKNRQKNKKSKCQAREFYCFKCHVPRKVWGNIIDITINNPNTVNLTGICGVCGTKLNRLASIKKLPETIKPFVVQQIHNQHLIPSFGLSCITHLKQGEITNEN